MTAGNSPSPSAGVLYIATGSKYIRAAVRSAETVRAHCPGLPIHLFGDWRQRGFDFDRSPSPFTTVGAVENPHPRSKVDYLASTPFERTLFLDTDTAVHADITGIFQLLDRFDIAMAHAPRRIPHPDARRWRVAVPDAFPQFNSGVLLYRRTPAVLAFLDEWRRCFHEAGFPQDQRTLRELLWLSDLRIATLPPEYNLRFLKYHVLWYPREASTQIFHRKSYHEGPFWLVSRLLRRMARQVFGPLAPARRARARRSTDRDASA